MIRLIKKLSNNLHKNIYKGDIDIYGPLLDILQRLKTEVICFGLDGSNRITRLSLKISGLSMIDVRVVNAYSLSTKISPQVENLETNSCILSHLFIPFPSE